GPNHSAPGTPERVRAGLSSASARFGQRVLQPDWRSDGGRRGTRSCRTRQGHKRTAQAKTGFDAVRANAMQILGAVCWRTWLKTARRPVVLTFSFVQPIMWILFFGFLFQRFDVGLVLRGVRYLDFLVPGVCAMTVLFGASQSGIGLIRDMQTGFLQRLFASPAT